MSTLSNHINISVIIPVYNAEKYLQECLDSVINQTLKDIEIICVDDGSTDHSLDILKDYAQKDNRIIVLTQQNRYAGVARNYGMSVASGEYFVFLDSDDFFEPNMLEEEYNKCKEYDADICICASDDFNNNTKTFACSNRRINSSLFTEDVVNKDILGARIFQLTTACPWNKMFRAEFLKQHNLSFQSLPRANDVYFVLCALFLAERIVGIDKIFVHYRVENNASLQSNNHRSPDAFLTALDGVYDRLQICTCSEPHKRAFSNIAIEHIGYNLRTLASTAQPEAYDQLFHLVQSEYLQKYDILGHTSDYFFNHLNINDLVERKLLPDNIWSNDHTKKDLFTLIRRAIHSGKTRGIGYTLKYSVKRIYKKLTGKS